MIVFSQVWQINALTYLAVDKYGGNNADDISSAFYVVNRLSEAKSKYFL